jgi:hypothetical protein
MRLAGHCQVKDEAKASHDIGSMTRELRGRGGGCEGVGNACRRCASVERRTVMKSLEQDRMAYKKELARSMNFNNRSLC